jgi:polysaccharide biosynthesis protein VpsJ
VTGSIDAAVARIRAWGEARDWRGYDPYDGLDSPLAPLLTAGTRLGRRVFTQAVKLSPVNLRPLLGIKPDWNAKAIALVASAYARLAAAGDESARAAAERWLRWLQANHSGDESGPAWGYHFPVETRFFRYARGAPNTIATSFVAHAFLDAGQLLGDARWTESARAAASFLTVRMLADGPGGPYFRYLPEAHELVHNANLLACAVLARAGIDNSAHSAVATSLRAQRSDGSWPYAEGRQGDWVDNLHTAYVLEALVHCEALEGNVASALVRGVDYWRRELFLPDGTPKYAPDRVFPLDAHNYASAIDAWLAVGDVEEAERLAGLLVDRMLDPAGYVWFQRRRLWTNRVPFVRWTTAPSFRALSGLLLARNVARVEEHVRAHLD